MADIESLRGSEHTSAEEGTNGVQEQSSVQGSFAKSSDDGHLPLTKSEQVSSEPSPASSSPGVGLVPLHGTTSNGTTPGASTVPTLSVPHPKKFTHVNINKKFLSSASNPGSTLSNTTAPKTGSTSQKPVVQSTASHSRLVTAKLTAGPQPSTVTGPGWSRPSSTGSTVAPTPPSSTNPKPSPLLAPATTHSLPTPAPAGKVIHPVPRSVADGSSGLKKDNGGKPAWGGSRLGGAGYADSVQSDFPTVAEVAQDRSAKLVEKKQAAQVVAAQKQAQAAEADAFRGVHLGSGHHWDEDEGDDDNFFEGVIEFGDGRQYTIPTEPRQSSPPRNLTNDVEGEPPAKPADQPVSKEERFRDDFDRSWPRGRGPGAPPAREPSHPHRPPSSASQPLVSPQEGPRVLFNEKSNRLEPYSNQPHRAGPPAPVRRDTRSDHTASPTEQRRDLPPHTGQRGVQLLQKPHDSPVDSNNRRGAGGSGFGNQGDRFRDRDPSRPNYVTQHPPSKQPSSATEQKSRDNFAPLGLPHLTPIGRDSDRMRWSSTGLSPVGTDSVRADGRPIPPHLTTLLVHPARGLPSATPSESNTGGLPSAPLVAHSPAASFASISPRVVDSPLDSTMPLGVDIDEVRKAAMHSAAERAKLRRQQEEEERERERERARRKAAELEARMKEAEEKAAPPKVEPEAKAKPVASEAEVLEVIEAAVQSVSQALPSPALETVPESSASTSGAPPSKPFGRMPSTRGGIRPISVRRPSFPSSTPAPDVVSPAAEIDSWRSKAGPLKPLHRPSHSAASSPVIPVVPPPSLVTFQEITSLTIQADEEVEIVDFSELGRLVGQDPTAPVEQEPSPVYNAQASRPPRPVATDFFEDNLSRQQDEAPSEITTWRRKSTTDAVQSPSTPEQPARSPDKPDLHISPPPPQSHIPPHRRSSTASEDHQRQHVPYGHPRSPLTPSYREAPMSALDDTMARIRGALTGLQHKPEPPAPKQTPKWIPPALRERPAAAHDESSDEIFDVTVPEPPRSPKPAWNQFVAKVPSVSHVVDPPLSKRQEHMAKTVPHVRSDIFSWDPPIDGMNRKDFHLNDLLFPRPIASKGGRLRYNVSLPRVQVDKAGNPVVNLPLRPPVASLTNGAFGKKKADESSSWRKTVAHAAVNGEALQGLDTTSRSPPPDTQVNAATTQEKDEAVSPTVSVAPVRSRSQPKMPEGSDVAFYRDSRAEIDSTPVAPVKFIVSSELEESTVSNVNGTTTGPQHRVNGDISPPPISRVVMTDSSVIAGLQNAAVQQIANDTKAESKKTEASPDIIPNPMSPWSSKSSPRVFSLKDSPSRPDMHLKAVFEATSNKADGLVNSLERIGDDMPAVTFTMQEVKAEVGETPPTSNSNPPSRMSQHDVTRAFQQVPTSASSSAPHRAAPAPHVPYTSPPSRPPNHSMPPPQHQGGRPMYPGYPSPLMSSPSPVVYPMSMTPSPIPRPMVVNGAPQYPQPMWVPMPGPPGSGPNGMMRPPPYGSQLMPYPPQSGMYGMQIAQPPNLQNRAPNGMPLMSPVMQQAHAHPHNGQHAVYAQSPVLMHAPAAGQPVNHAYPNANQPPRGQMRGAYDQAPGMMPYSPSGPHPPHAPHTYPLVPSHSFDRPW